MNISRIPSNIIDLGFASARKQAEKNSEEEYLSSVAFIYDSFVKSGSQKPVIEVATELGWTVEEAGAAIVSAMECRYLTIPKKNASRGAITVKGLKALEKHTMGM
jgi:hypothetical protein